MVGELDSVGYVDIPTEELKGEGCGSVANITGDYVTLYAENAGWVGDVGCHCESVRIYVVYAVSIDLLEV